jgi:hypothetical protein
MGMELGRGAGVPDTGVRRRGTIGGGPVPMSVDAGAFEGRGAAGAEGRLLGEAPSAGGRDGAATAGVTGAPGSPAEDVPSAAGASGAEGLFGAMASRLASCSGSSLRCVISLRSSGSASEGTPAVSSSSGVIGAPVPSTPGAEDFASPRCSLLLTGASIDEAIASLPARNQPISQGFTDEVQVREAIARAPAAEGGRGGYVDRGGPRLADLG